VWKREEARSSRPEWVKAPWFIQGFYILLCWVRARARRPQGPSAGAHVWGSQTRTRCAHVKRRRYPHGCRCVAACGADAWQLPCPGPGSRVRSGPPQGLDKLYAGRPLQRFWFLETVARMPYFSYISMLHLYESLGWWRAGAELRRVRGPARAGLRRGGVGRTARAAAQGARRRSRPAEPACCSQSCLGEAA
jgi:hypothetical protein